MKTAHADQRPAFHDGVHEGFAFRAFFCAPFDKLYCAAGRIRMRQPRGGSQCRIGRELLDCLGVFRPQQVNPDLAGWFNQARFRILSSTTLPRRMPHSRWDVSFPLIKHTLVTGSVIGALVILGFAR